MITLPRLHDLPRLGKLSNMRLSKVWWRILAMLGEMARDACCLSGGDDLGELSGDLAVGPDGRIIVETTNSLASRLAKAPSRLDVNKLQGSSAEPTLAARIYYPLSESDC